MKGKRLSKILVGICLVLILATISFMGACAKATPAPAPAPAPAPTPAPAPAPAPTPQNFILKYGFHSPPPPSGFATEHYWYFDQVEKRTEGRVKFECYYNNSLVPAKEAPGALKSGIADAMHLTGSYVPGQMPLLTIGQLPVIFSGVWSASMAWADMHRQMPALQKEMANWNARFLTISCTAPMQLITTKPVKTLDDIKGLKIRVLDAGAELLKALGATPVAMESTEVYDAMQKGILDGVVFGGTAIAGFKIDEVGKYFYDLPVQGNLCAIAINNDVWNKLPADAKKIMEDLVPEHCVAAHVIYQMEGDGGGLAAMTAKGVPTTKPSQADMEKVQEAAKPVWDKWVADMEKQGLPGREVLDTFLSLNAKYDAMSPFRKDFAPFKK